MGEDREPRFGLHTADEVLAATRDDHVDRAREPAEHEAYGRTIDRRHELDRGLGQSCGNERLAQNVGDHERGEEAFAPAPQDRGIAGFEAEPCGIGRHVRPRLVDDADHAERHADARYFETVWPRPARHHLTDRIGKRCDLAQPLRHGSDAGVLHGEPIEKRGILPLGARSLEVLGIRFENLGRRRLKPLGHDEERGVLRLGRGEREYTRRLARAAPHIEHHRLDAGLGSVGNRAHVKSSSAAPYRRDGSARRAQNSRESRRFHRSFAR